MLTTVVCHSGVKFQIRDRKKMSAILNSNRLIFDLADKELYAKVWTPSQDPPPDRLGQ